MYLLTALVAALATLALANPFAEQQQGKGPRADKCNSNVYNCLLTYYDYNPTSIQSYCTSFLSITTSTKILTSTDTSTSYTKTVTKKSAATSVVDGSTVTTVAVQTETSEVPISTTTVSTVYTGSTTVTSTVATVTDVSTATSTSFVCDLPAPSPIVTNAPRIKEKRQGQKPFTCADKSGSNGISSGCRCADPKTPTTTITTTSTKIVKTVSTIETVTATRTPVITATIVTTQTTNVVRSVTATDILTITSSVTATSSTVITTTVTRTSEAPRAFSLLFSDIASSTTSYGHISRPSDRPGSSGTLITFRDGAINTDLFSLNSQKQLVTSLSLDVLTLEKNSRDPFPFLFLENGTTPANTPVFSVCEGVLRAEYPGTQGNGFAVCDGFLSLGIDAVTGAPPCQRISLGFGEIPSGQILPQ